MKAFDTDVLTEVFAGNPAYAELIANVPVGEQAIPVVVVEEILRGRLNIIRQAEAAKARISLEHAYSLFEQSFADIREIKVLSYTNRADELAKEWRKTKIKVSTHDLRIAAICIANSATLVTRNHHDFEKIPNLSVEYWN